VSLHGDDQLLVRDVEPFVNHEHLSMREHHVVRVLVTLRVRNVPRGFLPRGRLHGCRAVRFLDMFPDLG
jgi:hypothetical protein